MNQAMNSLPVAARAQADGRIPTREAFTFRPFEGELALARGEKGPGRFRMTAYSGVPFSHPFWGQFAIDLGTLKLKAQRIPILREHKPDRIVGFSEKIDVGNKGIQVEGTFSEATPDSKEVAALAAEGFPWEASVYVPPGSIEFVAEGTEVEVNGQKLSGPGTIFRNAVLEEASFCALGADPRARARALSQEQEREVVYAFSQAGEARKDTMPDPKKTETPAPAAAPTPAPAPAMFSQEDLDARVKAALAADREARAKLSKEIREAAGPGQEKLAQDLIDRGASLEEATRELLQDAKVKLADRRAAFQKDPGARVAPSGGEAPPAPAAAKGDEIEEKDLILGRGQIDEAKAKVKFAADPAIRKEFGEEKYFLAFLKAESRGEVTTVVPSLVPRS